MKTLTLNLTLWVKSILTGAIILIGLIAPFTHIFVNHLDKELTEINKQKTILAKSINKQYKDLYNDLKNNTITVEQYTKLYPKIKTNKNVGYKKIKETKQKILNKHSFLGFKSFRVFLYIIGLPITLLILALRYWYKTLLHLPKSRYQKILYNLEAFAFTFAALYWITWAIFTKQDFKQIVYNTTFILITITTVAITYLILKHIIYTENTKLRVIQYLNKQIFVEIKTDFISLFNDDKYKIKYHKYCNEILDKQLNI
jgi:uncharacterized membrane protein